MTRLLFVFVSVCAFSSVLSAQVLRGIINDSQGNPVSFATVFVKESSFGTSANEEGVFELRLTEGTYTFVFQCMGYQTITKTLKVQSTNVPVVVVLPAMVYSLQEVVVSDGGEDPAYRIMRRVIRKAPLYAGMVKSFNADVYIRGSLNIKKISSMVKWMARDDLKESNIKEGDTYIEESVNEIQFTAPNLTRQKVKSIHSTFPGGN
ncbi:MAG: carboxypeptidase-like regulatory domain-containing protein, partial [Lentimicrobium sp.]|nr:carboxypeptidase-like regulatory domain-containing protein [Lentimicrobium sp.]